MLTTTLDKKSFPPRDFSHLRYAKFDNMEPEIESDTIKPSLYCTGSDGDLSAIASPDFSEAAAMMTGVEVGPSLRLAKSSSLESLQTVMRYTIHADRGDESGLLR